MSLRAYRAGFARALAVGVAWTMTAWTPAHAQPATTEPVVVAVSVNTQHQADLFVLRAGNGEFFIRHDDLAALGLRPLASNAPALVTLGGESYVRLDAWEGLAWQFDARALRLDLMAQPHLMPRERVEAGARTSRAEHLGGTSAFVNWAIQRTRSGHADGSSQAADAYSLETGARLGPVLLQATGNTAADGGGRFVRFMTTATADRTHEMQRWVAGDFFTTPTELGGVANLGGLALSKHFGMDPYRLRYPLGQVQGQAQLPSDVEVYVDGQLVRNERVRPGEFEIRDLYTQQGARSVQVVVRDPYGRIQRFDYSLYTSQDLLRAGLDEYQYALGALRRNFGTASADYGPPAFSAWHRHGITDALTLGLHAQGRGGLANAGPLFTARLGTAGVVSGSLAWSRAVGISGQAATLRYAYQADRWALGAAWRQESAGYAVLTDPQTISNRKASAQLYASRYWPAWGSLSASVSRQTVHAPGQLPTPAGYAASIQPARHLASLGYSRFMPSSRATFRAHLSRVRDDQGQRTDLSVGLTLLFDRDHVASLDLRRADGENVQSVQLRQYLPAGEGWGYDVAAERTSTDMRQWRAQSQYQGRHAVLQSSYRRARSASGTQDSLRLAASGGLAWVGGQAHLTRPIRDSFVLARVGQALADIPVSVNGNVVGVTDARGQLLLPDLGAFYEADISLEAQMLPIDYAVARLQQRVVLPARSGGVVDFGAQRVQAVVGRLVGGVPLGLSPVRVSVAGRELRAITGRDAELYLENVPAGRHAGEAGTAAAACSFDLEVPGGEAVLLELGDIRCEPRPTAAR